MPKVSLIKGSDRRKNIRRSLDLISEKIKDGLGSRRVVIKPNFVSISIPLAVSHVDQIRGILDYLKGVYKGRVIIAEAACGDTIKAYKNFGYDSLIDEYDAELIDLNSGPFIKMPIHDRIGKPIFIRVSSLLLDRSNYIISAAKLKTHDTVVVTLSIKNLTMGSIAFRDKLLVHQDIKQTNINITEIARHVWPDLAVIDGLVGMEGDGPLDGSPINSGVAISSTDPLAADRIACDVMGVDFNNVGYLHYCSEKGLGNADPQQIEIIGHPLRECIKPFRLHSSIERQYGWKG